MKVVLYWPYPNARSVDVFDAIVIDLDSHVFTYKEKVSRPPQLQYHPGTTQNNEDNLEIWARVGSEIWSVLEYNLKCCLRTQNGPWLTLDCEKNTAILLIVML